MKKIISLFMVMAMLIASIPAMAADSENIYTVSDLVFTDFEDNVIETPATSCIVRAMVTKNKARADVDSVVMVAYSSDGKLISFNVLKGTMVTNTDTQFSALINLPDGKKLGFVKVSVWDSVSNMNALSNVVRLDVNETAEPESGSIMPDTIEVYGRIIADYKSSGALPQNEVDFQVESLEYDYSDCKTMEELSEKQYYYDFIYSYYGLGNITTAGMPLIIRLKIAPDKTDILPYVLGKATLKVGKNTYDTHELTEFTYLDSNNIVTYENSLFDHNDYYYFDGNYGGAYFRYYTSEASARSEKCELSPTFELIVNGVHMMPNQPNIQQYIIDNNIGKITFVDNASADGAFDLALVDYYNTAVVRSVDTEENSIDVYRPSQDNITLCFDEDVIANIYLNDEKISLSDLKENDVLSIKCDPWDFEYSPFYDIYVSRDTAEGMYTGSDSESETVTIGGNKYKYAGIYPELTDNLTMRDEYKIYLDAFGRIAFYELIVS